MQYKQEKNGDPESFQPGKISFVEITSPLSGVVLVLTVPTITLALIVIKKRLTRSTVVQKNTRTYFKLRFLGFCS